MKAVGYQDCKTLDQNAALLDIELAQPHATGRDLLVKVAAVSVNPVDTKIRMRAAAEPGQYKVLGWDAVGEVVATGDDTSLFKVGDKVWYAGDLTRAGSNAQYQLVDERIVGPKPKSLSDAQAAALPLTAITAWELLFDRLGFAAQLPEGVPPYGSGSDGVNATLLIVGAAGGVGSILVQLAKQLTGATVVATASRPESQAWVTRLGADHVIDHHQPMGPQLAAKGIQSVSHVISLTHTDQHFTQLVELLAPQGKLALIDDPEEALDIKQLKRKSLSLHWEFMYTRSLFDTDDITQQHHLLSRLCELVDSGHIQTTLSDNFGRINAQNMLRAHRHIETGQTLGKIVLVGFD